MIQIVSVSRGTIGTSLYTFTIFWFPNRTTFPQTSQLSCVSAPHPALSFQKAKVSYLLCKCLLVTVTATISPSPWAPRLPVTDVCMF